jgi:ParB family chromosome partitioning protein
MSGELALDELKEIELARIHPNRLNPRLDVNIEKLHELADSIKQVGVLEPIIVRPRGDQYEVVVGERRYRASMQAGLEKVPTLIREFTDEQVIELNLIENIQREDLSAVEKGNCCKMLLETYPNKYGSKETLAGKVGVSVDTIHNWLKITEAPLEIQELVIPAEKAGVPTKLGKLDYNTALTITRQIKDPGKQVALAKEIAAKPIHGRRARKAVAQAARQPEKSAAEIVEEVAEEAGELTFTIGEKEPILKGLQIQTTRKAPLDPSIKAGRPVYATILEPRFASLRIVSIERKRLKYFTEEDAQAEGMHSLGDFKEKWIGRHGEWNMNQLVYVTRFEKVS